MSSLSDLLKIRIISATEATVSYTDHRASITISLPCNALIYGKIIQNMIGESYYIVHEVYREEEKTGIEFQTIVVPKVACEIVQVEEPNEFENS